jgi:Tol biopolymer transport system component
VLRLWSLPFDAKTRRVTGDATPITPANLIVSGFDLSWNGKAVVYMSARPGREDMELWSASLDGGQPTLLGEARTFFSPRVSRDGTRVASRITRDGLEGRRIAWLTVGRGDERLLPPGRSNPMDWSADGEQLLHTCSTPQRVATLCVSRVSDPNAEMRVLITDPAYAFWQGRFSPDGRWVLFNAQSLKQAGISILGIIPVAGGTWIPLTEPTLWADKARWAPDGRTIYFISNRDSAFFDVWGIEFDPVKGAVVGREFRVTNYANPGRLITGQGGSELGVSANRIVLPVVETTGSIWVLDNVK